MPQKDLLHDLRTSSNHLEFPVEIQITNNREAFSSVKLSMADNQLRRTRISCSNIFNRQALVQSVQGKTNMRRWKFNVTH
jgi:hypothetical protein